MAKTPKQNAKFITSMDEFMQTLTGEPVAMPIQEVRPVASIEPASAKKAGKGQKLMGDKPDKSDSIVFMNIPIKASLRDRLKIKAISEKLDLYEVVNLILEANT